MSIDYKLRLLRCYPHTLGRPFFLVGLFFLVVMRRIRGLFSRLVAFAQFELLNTSCSTIHLVSQPPLNALRRLRPLAPTSSPPPQLVAVPRHRPHRMPLRTHNGFQRRDVHLAHAHHQRHARPLQARDRDHGPLPRAARERRPVREPRRHQVRAAPQLRHHQLRRVQQRQEARVVPQRIHCPVSSAPCIMCFRR
jgi:hypothetical protein